MTLEKVQQGFRNAIDQYYAELKYMGDDFREKTELWEIGGILQAALHILPTEKYYELKRYTYQTHGYNPGGVPEQMNISEMVGGEI